ncbi:hypothetical protein SAY86_015705 [Trapa natans]|uniref:Uncharacterized protein n=1 Tax=Trapa natans TaxID=22666 RepID=A0AAN7L3T2_TRANT|nr:hypothetical protein SAY86_015705 [Trapa natans]
MSRCFPFPPPGYVKKAGVESAASVDLLKQVHHVFSCLEHLHLVNGHDLYAILEKPGNVPWRSWVLTFYFWDKRKEKKDRREKNREKRGGKAGKERDWSDEKHRDKNEKKNKHSDRKDKNKGKEKEKEREKDCTSSLSDKKFSMHAGGTNEETTPKEKCSLPLLLPSGLSVDRSARKEKERDKQRTITPDGKKPVGQFPEKNPTFTNLLRDRSDNNKFVQELEKRIKIDRSSGTQLAERFIVAEKKKDDIIVQFSEKPNANIRPEVKESNKERRDTEPKVERANGTLKVQDVVIAVQTRVKVERTLVERNIQREIDWREKVKGRDGEDNWANKLKEKEVERKDQGKPELDRERDKERMREMIQHSRHTEQEKLKLSRKNDTPSSPNRKNLQLPVKGPDRSVTSSGSVIKKRKETEVNGFLHANDIRENKIPKQSLVSHSPMENGRMQEPCRSTSPVAPSPWSGPANNGNNILKENGKINGIIESWAMPPVSPVKVQSSASVTDPLTGEVPIVKLPYPDCKLLDEILSRVPRLEELPELDGDQGWLFDSDDRENSKKSMKRPIVVDKMSEVWGESLHIESADICALPYVIPY